MNRRRLLGAVVAGVVGLAGCGSDATGDDYDPELVEIDLWNRDETSHTIALELFEFPGTNVPDPANRIATATVDLPPDWTEQVSEFPGRGARRYELRWRVDAGAERTFRTGEIRGCTEIEFEIGPGGAVDVAERARTICYGQDD